MHISALGPTETSQLAAAEQIKYTCSQREAENTIKNLPRHDPGLSSGGTAPKGPLQVAQRAREARSIVLPETLINLRSLSQEIRILSRVLRGEGHVT